ncbi:VOC family protein [Parapedobacter sp. ISTM3]|uniref:Lactoylglutathione lyase n=1 Tax=Parapedobacter luteus TaxID=623280 RepID=A0A1T5BWR5_9SPHI|nr:MULTISPECIES: VOC family protein [Parapedobacter]MBK1442300.1 VOC family protein [Parapedobacter sp. ISTM3]SKB51812.1 lactoylglutathione lyase [Parapedobacter luteus]
MKQFLILYAFIGMCFVGGPVKSYAQVSKGGFNHIALSVYDLEKSASFYREVLLLDTLPEPFKIGKHKWFEIAPGFSLHLVADAAEIKEHNRSTHICFSVASIDDFIDRLDGFGIVYYNVQHEPGKVGTRVDGVKQLYIKDPDGYWIEINDEQR